MKESKVWLLLLFLIAFSCAPHKDLNYMQDIDQLTSDAILRNTRTTLQPGDDLVINIMAKDLDVAKPFNQNYSSGQVLQNPISTGNVSPTIPTASGPTYVVDQDGFIDMPVLGKILTKDLTVDQLKSVIYNKVSQYIKEPTISVKLNNFKVQVMGEVNRPGEYVLADGKGTVLSALSMAGDLTVYGNRDDILLIRTVDGKLTKQKIDITKYEFLDSPFYSLRQGDVLYVSPNKTRQKYARLDPNSTIYISVASIVVTILALVFK